MRFIHHPLEAHCRDRGKETVGTAGALCTSVMIKKIHQHSLLRTDAPPAVLPAGKLVGLRGNRPDSAPNPLLWLLWYMLSAASATAVLPPPILTPTPNTHFPPRVGQAQTGGAAVSGGTNGSYAPTKGNFAQRTGGGYAATRSALRPVTTARCVRTSLLCRLRDILGCNVS